MTSATTATAKRSTPLNNASTADAALKKYATQVTAATAVVTCVTGVMMFFHLYKGEVQAMHEWLGMGFVVAVVLHLARHRRPLAMMLVQNRMRVLLLVTALISAAFLYPASSGQSQGNPMRSTVDAVLRAPIEDVAPVFGLSSKEMITRLSEAGATNVSEANSIESAAVAAKTPPMRLLAAVVSQPAEKD